MCSSAAIWSSIRWLYCARRSLTRVFLVARSALHSRRNRRPQNIMPGALKGFTRSAVSSTVNERSSSFGAEGDAHHLQVRGLGKGVSEAVDLAAQAQTFGQARGLFRGRDPAGDRGIDAHNVPGATRQVVGGLLKRPGVDLARGDRDVERSGEGPVGINVLVAQRHLEPLVAQLIEVTADADCVTQAVRPDRVDHQGNARPDLLPYGRAQLDVPRRVAPNVELDGAEPLLEPDLDLALEIGDRRVSQRACVRRQPVALGPEQLVDRKAGRATRKIPQRAVDERKRMWRHHQDADLVQALPVP